MIKKTISKNIQFNAIGQVVIFIANFILFPFIVSHVGKDIYGAYLLVMTFTGYLGLFDFGIGAALIKYVADSSGKEDYRKTQEFINASLTLYVIAGLLSSITLFIFSFIFQNIFSIDPVHQVFIQRLFWVASSASLFLWVGRIFDNVLQGLQRYDIISKGNIASSLATVISAFMIFNNGLGMGWFLATSYCFILVKYAIFYIFSKRQVPGNITFPYFNQKVLKQIFSFSIFMFLGNVVGMIIFNIDNIVIGSFVSVAAVSVYGVGYVFQQGFRTINSFIGGPLFPAGAGMEGRNEYEKQKQLFLRGTKYTTLFFTPMVIITIFFAGVFIRQWMGENFNESILPAQVLMFFWIFNNTLEVGSGLLSAKGYVKENFQLASLNAFLNLSLSLFLVRYFGILGVALGTTIPMVLVYFPLVLQLILKVLNVKFIEFFTFSVKKNIPIYIISIGLPWLVLSFYNPSNLFFTLASMAIIYLIVIAIGIRFSISPEERKEIMSIVKI